MDHAGHSPHGDGHGPQTLAALVAERTGSSPLSCYQCGRCAAGCMQNVDGEMDVSPTRIMRLLQLEAAFAGEADKAGGYAARALAADTPWLCAGCLACTTRCPQNVDIAGTMDALREEALRRNAASHSRRARDIQSLHKTFLAQALGRGRIHEVSMIIKYKLRTWHFLQDAMLGPAMFLKGKLHLLGGAAPDTQPLQKAVDQLKREGAER